MPQSPPRHTKKPCDKIGRMGEAEPGKLVLFENSLCLHAARDERIQRVLSHRDLKRAMRTREHEAQS